MPTNPGIGWAPADSQVEMLGLERQRKYAEALRRQSTAPLQGQMVGNQFVAPAWTQQLANVLGGVVGQGIEEKADARQLELATALRQQNAQDASNFTQELEGRSVAPTVANDDEGNAYPPVQMQPNRAKAMAIALNSQNPALQSAGAAMLKEQIEPETAVVGRTLVEKRTGRQVAVDSTWQQEQMASREARERELQLRMEDARTAREDKAALAREIQQLRLDGQRELRQMTAAAGGGRGQVVQTDQGMVLVDPRTGTSRPVTGQDGQPLQPKLKDLPAAAQKSYMENSASLRKIDDALGAIEKYPDALGLKNYMGDTLTQRLDPKGVEARALVADVGSLKIHDRSGAAVTAAETPRLKPFIPSATDNPETANKKLRLFRREYQAIQDELLAAYPREQGFRTPGLATPPASPAAPSPAAPKAAPARISGNAEYDKLPSGTTFVGPDGKTRVKP